MQTDFIIEAQYPNLSHHLLKGGGITDVGAREFQALLHNFYAQHSRDFAWRQTHNPYHILVSEIMLQQTQTDRVIYKFALFIEAFPDFAALAQAPFSEVLRYWHGLGYNRRALALHNVAKRVIDEFGGALPCVVPEKLQTLPGIGPYTAAAICTFAFNQPTVFIETNIRAVYIHTFFRNAPDKISDKILLPLVEQTLDQAHPRTCYYALMDYGVAIKKAFGNPCKKSAHYARQSKFEGSERQIRGMILRALTSHGPLSLSKLKKMIPREPKRIQKNVDGLRKDGLLKVEKTILSLIE